MSLLWRYMMSQIFKVFKYSELSVTKIWGYVQEYLNLLDYYPDVDPGKLSEFKCLFRIMETRISDKMKQRVVEVRETY